jgi:hypothetical protein
MGFFTGRIVFIEQAMRRVACGAGFLLRNSGKTSMGQFGNGCLMDFFITENERYIPKFFDQAIKAPEAILHGRCALQ